MPKKPADQGQKIAKIYQDFLLEVAKIEKERDLKINKIIKRLDEEKIRVISASFKKRQD